MNYRDEIQTDGDFFSRLSNSECYSAQLMQAGVWATITVDALTTIEWATTEAIYKSQDCDTRVVRVSCYPVHTEIKTTDGYGHARVIKRLQFVPFEVIKFFKKRN